MTNNIKACTQCTHTLCCGFLCDVRLVEGKKKEESVLDHERMFFHEAVAFVFYCRFRPLDGVITSTQDCFAP